MSIVSFFKNNYYIGVLVGLVCTLVVFFGIHSYVHWKGNYHFGQVVTASPESVTFLGKGDREYIVDISPTTVIKKGLRVQETAVLSGDRVIVIGRVDQNAHIDASFIRILGHK